MPAPTSQTLIWGLFANGGQLIQSFEAGLSALFGMVSAIFGLVNFLRATPASHRSHVSSLLATGGALLVVFGIWRGLVGFFPTTHVWATPSAIAAAMAVAFGYGRFGLQRAGPEGVPLTPKHMLKLVDSRVVSADKYPSVEYKRKLYIVVQNLSELEILIGPGTTWKAGDLRIREIPQQKWEIAPANGWDSDQWTYDEKAEIRLKPGQFARTWVGLHPAATQEEFAALSGRVGTLSVPVKVLGEVREQLPL